MGAESTRNMYSNLAVNNKYDCLKLHHVGYLIKYIGSVRITSHRCVFDNHCCSVWAMLSPSSSALQPWVGIGLLVRAISIIFWACVSVCYPACNAHAPYYIVILPVRLCLIFPHYLINGTIFGKKILNTKCVFWFSLQVLSETFLVLRRNGRDIIKKCVLVWM
jgi:hypothetical protein